MEINDQVFDSQLLQQKVQAGIEEIKKVVVGQDYMINRLLIGLFTNGHILLEGMPGLAKTLTVNTLANVLDLDFQRIQFTPDLLPSDLVGTMIYNPQSGNFDVKKGPIFSNIVLADEINRSPAKVQAALLECMAEKQVTIGDTTYGLEKPFLVLATQNPIEQEGTYELPEAQVDRFLMKVKVGYPDRASEMEVMKRMSNLSFKPTVNQLISKEDINKIKQEVNSIALEESVERYAYRDRRIILFKLGKIVGFCARVLLGNICWAPAGTRYPDPQLVAPPFGSPAISGHFNIDVGQRFERIETVEGTTNAVNRRIVFQFFLEGAEESIPEDKDTPVIAVHVAFILCVVNPVIGRRNEYPFIPSQFGNVLGMHPVLVKQIERTHSDDNLRGNAEQVHGNIENPA